MIKTLMNKCMIKWNTFPVMELQAVSASAFFKASDSSYVCIQLKAETQLGQEQQHKKLQMVRWPKTLVAKESYNSFERKLSYK